VVIGKFLKFILGLILLSSIGSAVLFFPQISCADQISLPEAETWSLLKEATGMASRRTILFEGTLDRIF